MHSYITEKLHLPLSEIRPFREYVGNGEALLCTHVSKLTKIEVKGSIFLVDLHILPVHGPDVILGMDWLESLGSIYTHWLPLPRTTICWNATRLCC